VSEREIVLKIKSGDTNIFSEVIDEYSAYLAKVITITNVYSLNIQDVEDIIAETMISVWKNSKKLNADLSFKSYIATIAKNKTVDHVRKMRINMVELDMNFSDDTDIENDFLRQELANLVNSKIDQIKEPDRSILLLKYQHGLKSKEIADKLNINANIVDIRLSRQRSKLKKMLLKMEVCS